MKEFSSEVKYVEATPRRQRRKNGSYNVSYGGSTSSGDNSALKSYVDSNFVNRLIAQEIEAIHNFLNGFTIAGIPFRKMDNGSLFIDANVVFGGGATMYGTDSTPAPSIFDGLPIDGRTIKRDGNGALYVDETALSVSGGGGVADSVAWANVTGKPTWITNTKPTYNYSEIQGTPDLSVYALESSLANYALKTSIPTNNNQLTNGAGYITAEALNGYAKLTDIPSLNGYATETFVNTAVNGAKEWVEEQQYLTEITSGMIESVLGYQPYDGDTNSKGFLTSSALNGYATQSWVNTALAGYLSLSGGTINGSLSIASGLTVSHSGTSIVVKRTQNFPALIKYENSNGVLGQVGVNTNGTILFIDASGNYRTLLDSGNYTNYALSKNGGTVNGSITANSFIGNLAGNADSATSAKSLSYVTVTDLNNVTQGTIFKSSIDAANKPSGTAYITGIALATDSNPEYRLILGFDNYGQVFTRAERGGVWDSWSKLARTHDNVASATKLETSRTIWGQSFDGTGNVVGDLILQSATNVSSNGDSAILRFNGANYATGDIVTGPSIRAIYDSYYGRKRLAIFQHNSNDYITESEVFSILPNGNVAIGGTTANAKLHVYGDTIIESSAKIYDGLWCPNSYLTHIGFSVLPQKGPWYGVKSFLTYDEGQTLGVCRISTSFSTKGLSIAFSGGNPYNLNNVDSYSYTDMVTITNANGVTIHSNLLTSGGITMYSQRSLKNILSYDGLSLEQLSVIKPIKFTWKDGRDNRYHVGGVADDVATVVPEVVYSANDFLTMDYGNAGFYVAASLIKPVVDHETRIKQLERRVKELENENKQLRQS